MDLFQKDVAQQAGVNEWTYLLWEHDRTFPNIRMWPTVIRFLGYYPFPKPQTLSNRLIAFRRRLTVHAGDNVVLNLLAVEQYP